jgi:Flp pilus assembly protein TadG
MALVLPLLILLTFGVIDLGRVLFTHIAVHEAAQEGAMYGSFVPHDHAAVRQRVIESVDSPVFGAGDVAVTCPGSDRIQVEVTHDLELLTPMVGEWFGGNVTIARTVTGTIFSETLCGG